METTDIYRKYVIDSESIYFVGDIHGDFGSISGLIKSKGLRDVSFVFCGDIGLGFNKAGYYIDKFGKLDNLCSQNGISLFFLRGNHDDPSYFSADGIRSEDNELVEFNNVHILKDYSVIQARLKDKGEYFVLCVGGAISIDRNYRRQYNEKSAIDYLKRHDCSYSEAIERCRKGYWEDEPPVFKPEAIDSICEDLKIDVVATHTCPSFVYPTTKDGIMGWIQSDPALEGDCDAERKCMDDIYGRLKDDGCHISRWFYGHFHHRNVETIKDGESGAGTTFICNDMCRYGKLDYSELLPDGHIY